MKIQKYRYQRQFFPEEGGIAEMPEIAAARTRAFIEGKEQGIQETKDELYRIVLDMRDELERVNLLRQQTYQQITQEILVCTQTIVQKLLPYLHSKYLAEEISHFVKQALNVVKPHALLTLTVHPCNLARLKTHLQPISQPLAFKTDESCHPSDCVVTWEDGGIEKITSQVSAHIDQALEDLNKHFPSGADNSASLTMESDHA